MHDREREEDVKQREQKVDAVLLVLGECALGLDLRVRECCERVLELRRVRLRRAAGDVGR